MGSEMCIRDSIGPDFTVEVGADLKGGQVVVVFGGVAQGVLAIAVLFAAAIDNPS